MTDDVLIKSPGALSSDEREAWRALQDAEPMLASPYFSLGYLDAVAAVRSDVRVVIQRRAGAPTAFLPLQRGVFGHARPLGGPLSDHHGVIGHAPSPDGLNDMLRRAGVGVFDYHGALALQPAFRSPVSQTDGSWVVDLSGGYDAWRARRKKPGGNTLRTIMVAERKLDERYGAVEFCFEDRSRDALDALYAWKSDQYRRSGHFDVFSAPWTVRLVDQLLQSDRASGARGLVSSLRVDGALAAVHFGMMSQGVMHYWFPAYDPAFQKEGSGNALLLRMFRALSERGVGEVHLGGGDYRYKAALSDWQFPLAQGFAGHGAAHLVRTLAHGAERVGRRAGAGPLGDLPGRVFRRIDRMAGFRPA